MDSAADINIAHLSQQAYATFVALEHKLGMGLATLADKPEETVRVTLAALWSAAAGSPQSAHAAQTAALGDLATDAHERLLRFIEQRLSGIPLAHITGRQHFMGLELIASPEALIPREETALLGRAAAARLDQLLALYPDREICIVDVCTGSGNLALALAHHAPRVRVWAADLSADAVRLAQRNAEATSLNDRVHFYEGDLLAPFDSVDFHGKVDLLVCNPPYISSAKVTEMPHEISQHEPHLAFDGGPLGIRILMRLIADAPRFLRAGGWLAFEVGLGQGRGVRRKLEQSSAFSNIEEIFDRDGQTRAFAARLNTHTSLSSQ